MSGFASLHHGANPTRATPPKWLDLGPPGRRARKETCKRCGRDVLRGRDHDHAAHDAIVDPTPLDRQSELTALIAGLRTYGLWTVKYGHELEHRDRWAISGTTQVPILADHECQRFWPAPEPTAPKPHVDPEEIPF